MRNNHEGGNLDHMKLRSGMSFGINKIASSATINLGATVPAMNIIVAGAALNLVLPAPSAALEGRFIYIYNAAPGANAVTIKQNDGTTTVVAVAQNKCAMVFTDGTTWYGFLGA